MADTNEAEPTRRHQRHLPIANVSRIMKQCLPKNTKISKGAKENAQACVSEFVLFVTSEASDKCQREKRKTIGGEDILWALATLGFEDFVPKLHEFLIKYRESENGDECAPKDEALE